MQSSWEPVARQSGNPEEGSREDRSSRDRRMEFLEEIGRDCVGAMQFLHEGETPSA